MMNLSTLRLEKIPLRILVLSFVLLLSIAVCVFYTIPRIQKSSSETITMSGKENLAYCSLFPVNDTIYSVTIRQIKRPAKKSLSPFLAGHEIRAKVHIATYCTGSSFSDQSCPDMNRKHKVSFTKIEIERCFENFTCVNESNSNQEMLRFLESFTIKQDGRERIDILCENQVTPAHIEIYRALSSMLIWIFPSEISELSDPSRSKISLIPYTGSKDDHEDKLVADVGKTFIRSLDRNHLMLTKTVPSDQLISVIHAVYDRERKSLSNVRFLARNSFVPDFRPYSSAEEENQDLNSDQLAVVQEIFLTLESSPALNDTFEQQLNCNALTHIPRHEKLNSSFLQAMRGPPSVSRFDREDLNTTLFEDWPSFMTTIFRKRPFVTTLPYQQHLKKIDLSSMIDEFSASNKVSSIFRLSRKGKIPLENASLHDALNILKSGDSLMLKYEDLVDDSFSTIRSELEKLLVCPVTTHVYVSPWIQQALSWHSVRSPRFVE
jgi:hypothetical protein